MATNQINYGEDVTGSTIDLSDLSSAGVSINDPYITTGTNLNWNDLYTTTTTGTGGSFSLGAGWITDNGHSDLSVQGDADFAGDVRVKGRSLAEFMESVEQRLNMLRPNPRLEAEWDQLHELGKQYRALEKQLLEKEQMWQTLKR
jgi:hypothetical protein